MTGSGCDEDAIVLNPDGLSLETVSCGKPDSALAQAIARLTEEAESGDDGDELHGAYSNAI